LAKKGQSKHRKRSRAPAVLKLPRKRELWTIKPAPGPHPGYACMPLGLAVRDYLSLARTASEASRLLSEGRVLVDGKVRRDPKLPVGLMDVIQIPATGKSYRVLVDEGGRLFLREIEQAEVSFKLCKVLGKNTLSGGRVQLAFHDGKTLVGELAGFKLGDVAKLALPELKIEERLAFEEGAVSLVTGGSNIGRVGRIKRIEAIPGRPALVTLEADGSEFQAPSNYVFIVGKERPLVSVRRGA